MRILHTSDWHLGKSLEGFSRLEEQERFIDEFLALIEEEEIDLVIIAGDIYDNGNPPASAEKLFYNSLKAMTKLGKRGVLVISGNHDHPERLSAANPLAHEHGIIILGTPKSTVNVGRYGSFEVTDAGEGFVEISMKGERAVVITLPYPSEKRLNEILSYGDDEEARRKSYSERIGEIFSKLSEKYREDTINLAVAHLFVVGGEGSESERPIELGGSLAVDAKELPERAQYIALGHLHKPQQIKTSKAPAYYSGSPLPYSKSEVGYKKRAYIVDVKAGEKPDIKEVFFKNDKPIEVWKCSSIENAVEKCKENSSREVWVYLEIKTEEYISQEKIKQMKELKKDIIEIRPVLKEQEEEKISYENLQEKSMAELFRNFYLSQRDVEPAEELMDLFLRIAGAEEGEELETEEA